MTENLSFGWTRRDWLVLGAVLAVIFIVLIPFTFLLKGVFHDDMAYIYYPHFTFMARNLQQGIIPLWSPNVFCGGSPFYANYPFGALYPPLWMLLGMADLSTPASSYIGLIIVPIIFHLLLSGVFAYLLGRLGVGLEYWGAAAFALVWTLSATMYRGILDVSPFFTMSWIPAVLLFQILHTRTGKAIYLALGGVVLGLMIPSNINYVAYAAFIVMILSVCFAVAGFISGRYRSAFRALWGPAAMGVLGGLLAGGYLWGVFESVRDMAPFYPLDRDQMTAGPNSLPFRYLATLLVPTLFAEQDFSHVWNVIQRDQLWVSEAYLTRGLPFIFIAFIAVAGLWLRKGNTWRELRFWMFAGVTLSSLGILLLLGRYTPVYGFFYRFCPLVRVPYANRWHPVYTMGLAILIGVGISAIRQTTPDRPLLTFRKFSVFLISVFLIVVITIAWPLTIGRERWFPGWLQLVKAGHLGWFFFGPMRYLVFYLIVLGFVSWHRLRRWAVPSLFILLVAHLAVFMYHGMFDPWQVRWDDEKPTLTKRKGPGEDPYLEFGREQPAPDCPSWGPSRMAYSRSTFDNTQLIKGGFAVLGWPGKPLVPRLHLVLRELCSGFPHELLVENFQTRFFQNMSAGIVWLDRPYPGGIPETVHWTTCLGYRGLQYTNPVPRLFTLDRVRAAPPEDQRKALMTDDLKKWVWVDPEEPSFGNRYDPPADRKYFDELQRSNRIGSFQVDHPNHLTAEIEITIPAMMVCTDVYAPGWMATVDGQPAYLIRVNYLQRGVWLEEGKHRVEMIFHPRALIGWQITGSLGVLFIIVLIWSWRVTRLKSE